MGKDKRKARLNKGEAGEFIGFGAFATMAATNDPPSSSSNVGGVPSRSSSASASTTGIGTAAGPSSTSTNNTNNVTLSPVYLGSDPNLNILFSRISQKRDATTKAKALNDLLSYFVDNAQTTTQQQQQPQQTSNKKQQVDALSHFLYLYTTKLHYQHDSQTSSREIRCLCIKVIAAAQKRLPKAFVNLTQSNPIVLGMIVCARCDPAMEVRSVAKEFVDELLLASAETSQQRSGHSDDNDDNNISSSSNGTSAPSSIVPGTVLDEGVWVYVHKILSYTKPLDMYQDLFQRGAGGGGGNNSDKTNKKGSMANRSETTATSSSPSSSSSLSDRNIEEMDEKYERIVGTALDGLNLYIQEPSVLRRSVARLQPEIAHATANHNDDATPAAAVDVAHIDHRGQNSDSAQTPTTPDRIKYVWKTISSGSAPLRRKTYTLLSTFCQRLPYLLDNDKTSKMIQQALSSEKEPINVAPALLETMLAFVASNPKSDRSNIMTQYSKALTKLFKKGCYGASASSWCQMVLPIVALLPAEGVTAPQAGVLTSVLEGRTFLLGVSDTLDLINAVVETSTFLLVQQQPNDLDQVIASCWIQALQTFLISSNNKTIGNVGKSREQLSTSLAKSWATMSNASVEKPRCAIFAIQQWFWSEQVSKIILQENLNRHHLTRLLDQICQQIKERVDENDSTTEHIDVFSETLRRKFYTLVSSIDDKNTWSAEADVYAICIAILRLISPKRVFANYSSESGHILMTAETFILNKLLPWIIRHTSSLSSLCDSSLGKLEGELFLSCIEGDATSISSGSGSLAESVMREVVAAKPDLSALWDYACLYMKYCHWVAADFVDLEFFQKYCRDVAKDVFQSSPQNVNDETHNKINSHDELIDGTDGGSGKTYTFLLNVVGLENNCTAGLMVSSNIILEWIDMCCPIDSAVEMKPNPVLDVLVLMVKADPSVINHSQVKRVIIQSWRQGGITWRDKMLPWLLAAENNVLRSGVMVAMREDSFQQLRYFSKETRIGGGRTMMWKDRAIRLLQLCGDSKEAHESGVTLSSTPLISLSAVGMGDIQLWKENQFLQSAFITDCLLQLLRHVEETKRWKLFLNSETNAEELLVAVLVHLSGGSTTPLRADRARCYNDDAAYCLKLLNFKGSDQNAPAFKAAVQASTSLSTHLGSPKTGLHDDNIVCRKIAVLSQLIRSLFAELRTSSDFSCDDEIISAENAEKGKAVWYIIDPETPLSRVQCTILKVHADLPDDVYFTIEFSGADGERNERQTLGSRLRLKDGSASNDKSISDVIDISMIDNNEKTCRSELAHIILDSLTCPSISSSWNDPCFEIYNIVLAQVGLLEARGIGTVHYNVLQRVSAIQTALMAALESPEPDEDVLAATLFRLSYALGWGMNTPSSLSAISLLGINASDTLPAILAYLQDPEREGSTKLYCAAVAWLSVASFHSADKTTREESFSTLFQVAARLLRTRNQEKSGFDNVHYIALRAMEKGQLESHKSKQGGSSINDSEAEAVFEMINAFSKVWNYCHEEETEPDRLMVAPDSIPVFHSVMEATIKERPSLVAGAARRCLDSLTHALYLEPKRLYAIQILDIHGREGRPIHTEDEYDIINSRTNKKLQEWSAGLSQEEVESLEDNVFAVAQWTCAAQMNDIENWHSDDDINDLNACGRMLSWLSFLNVVDAASVEDSVFYRPSFTRYVTMCQAVEAMLDLALVYGNVGTNRSVKLDKVLPLDEIIPEEVIPGLHSHNLSKLAALVISRSIELFPTLCKNWWDTECPGYAKQAVQEFVESEVSPEILKRALSSIEATDFGEMKVKGSIATRQVAASYMQDDFTLSVAIELPSAYPFRRAMVDCSKTLGVPESRWKRWSLQITQMLNNQGGTLKEALLFWKDNVDKEFEGVEPCPVCYNVLHVQNHKQPNIECRTCSNRFHFLCLETWFRQSGKNNCVICQQPWSGIRV